MALSIFIFIIFSIFCTMFLFYWVLIKRLNALHKDVRRFDTQLKAMIESLEKKICQQELDVEEVKDNFKQIQSKITSRDSRYIGFSNLSHVNLSEL